MDTGRGHEPAESAWVRVREGQFCTRGRESECRALSRSQQQRPNNKWLNKIAGLIRDDKKRNTDIAHNILCPFRCQEPHVCAALDGWDLCSMLSEKSIWGSPLPPEPHLPSHPGQCRTRATLVRVTPISAMPRERTKTVSTN